jgi:hypothetical protein
MRAMVTLVLIARTALADEPPPDPLKAARELKVGGATVTGAGLVTATLGAALLVAGAHGGCFGAIAAEEGPCAYSQSTASSRTADSLFLSGMVLSVIGDVLVVAGAPLWAVGARRERRLRATRTAR